MARQGCFERHRVGQTRECRNRDRLGGEFSAVGELMWRPVGVWRLQLEAEIMLKFVDEPIQDQSPDLRAKLLRGRQVLRRTRGRQGRLLSRVSALCGWRASCMGDANTNRLASRHRGLRGSLSCGDEIFLPDRSLRGDRAWS